MKSFSELTRKEKAIELLWWIGVLPVAMLAGLVGHMLTVAFVVHPVLSGLSYEGTGRWLRHLIGGFLGGAAFVVAGAKTAPRFRRATALVLAVGHIVSAVGIHWIHHRDIIPVIAATVAAVGGTALLFYSERSKGRHAQTDQPAVAGE
ncbi:MAG: hypothetical protein AABP62_16930 [Planctomycetota bacterium]